MTTYYVGSGGNNGNAGTSWAQRKLTLNGAEDIPVAAGDTVYVGPGTYRETLTVDVSGSGGSPITYIGDYTGANTDGIGGVVRITGSDNDQTAARANCITATTKNYRTFQGFNMDITSGPLINCPSGATDWVVDKCIGSSIAAVNCLDFVGVTSNITVQNCVFKDMHGNTTVIRFSHSSTTTSTGSVIQNCLFIGGGSIIIFTRVDGVTVKNCVLSNARVNGIIVNTALAVGNSNTVNNCIIQGCTVGINATVTGEIVEDYNSLTNTTNRTNTNTGANSNAYPPLFDPRWFFQLVTEGAGPNSVTQVITPFDLSSLSQLLNVAGTSPTTTDMRGTAVQSTQREWGALEYDSTLKVEGGGGGGSIFGGAVVR